MSRPERPHGTRAKYVVEKCRCAACRRANSDYQTMREKRKAYEAWGDIKPALVPADEVREHLAFLSEVGVGLRQVHRVTGIHRSTLQKLKRKSARVRYETADRILAVSSDDRAAGRWPR
jgi:arginyl-tRNA--protein-N-Asp/Glu arginylyltransferase